jgi:signal transduction histidine kinase
VTRRRRPRSLTATGVAVLLLATMAAAALSIGLLLNRHAVVIADTELEVFSGRAHALALGLKRTPEGGWRLSLARELAARFDPAYRRSFYAVLDASGRTVASSMAAVPGEVPFVLPNSAELEEPTTFRVRRGDTVLRGASIPIEVEGTTFVIQVADNVRHPDVVTDDLSEGFLGRVSWVVLPVFAALAAVAFGTLWLCMRPIERLSRRAAELAGGGGERLPEDETPLEIQPLVRAMNAALDRAERAQAAQRGFTAEAAHQMRTPLAVLKTHAELIQDRRAAEALGADIAALERIVDQLLALAEVDAAQAGPPGGPVDLAALARAAADFLEPLAAGREVELELDAPAGPVPVPGHEEPLYQAVLNLLQNAVDHSPPGGTVRLSVREPGTVEVADQGAGAPEHQRDLVFRRFWRARADRAGRRRGAGLGLAIVQRVAELHSGSVSVHAAPGGGALFRLAVPAGHPVAGPSTA